MSENKEGFLPCPRCGSHDIEWTNSRDLHTLTQWIECNGCNLHAFHVDTTAFVRLPSLDFKTSLMKWNAWVKTNPTSYYDEFWANNQHCDGGI